MSKNAMQLEMNPDVQRIAEFMQSEFPADQLRGLAEAVGKVAPVLWGRYSHTAVYPLHLNYPPVTN